MLKMSQLGWNICICQSLYSKCKQMPETFFLEQHINTVHTVAHRGFLFIDPKYISGIQKNLNLA